MFHGGFFKHLHWYSAGLQSDPSMNSTRWVTTNYKWSHNPYLMALRIKKPYKWTSITLLRNGFSGCFWPINYVSLRKHATFGIVHRLIGPLLPERCVRPRAVPLLRCSAPFAPLRSALCPAPLLLAIKSAARMMRGTYGIYLHVP